MGFKVTGRHPFDKEGDELEMIISEEEFKEVNPMAEVVEFSGNSARGYYCISDCFAFRHAYLEVA